MHATYKEQQFIASYDAVSFTTQYSADASDLGLKPGQFPSIVQIDRLDDKPMTMHLHGVDKNPDGDITVLCYSPLRTHGNHRFALTIFND